MKKKYENVQDIKTNQCLTPADHRFYTQFLYQLSDLLK